MKIRKIFAGMAASAIALSMMAISASAYNAGISFQTTNYTFRNGGYEPSVPGSNPTDADFPTQAVGVQGISYGYDKNASCSDVSIDHDGTYTVSIAKKGTITDAPSDDSGFYINESKTLSRIGSPWSMLYAYETTTEVKEDTKQEDLVWEPSTDKDHVATGFKMLFVCTDIEVEDWSSDDRPIVNGQEIVFSNVVVDFGDGQSFQPADSDLYCQKNNGQKYVNLQIINQYGDSAIDQNAFLNNDDGEISITFTVSGLDKKEDESSSETDSSSKDDGSSATDSTDSKAGDTSSAGTDSSGSGSGSTDSAASGSTDSTAADGADAGSGTTDDSKSSDSSSSSSSTAAASASSSKASTSSAASASNTTAAKTTTATGGGSTTTTSSSAAAAASADSGAPSDATENAPAGVPAGLALGFVALAGAVAVVAKKR